MFIPAIVIGGQMAGAIGVTLVHPEFVAAVLSLAADTGGQLCAGPIAERATGAGDAAGGANSRGRAGVCGDDCAVAPSAGGGSEASVLSQRKNENAFTGGVNGYPRKVVRIFPLTLTLSPGGEGTDRAQL
uniref:Uncharacterized protein n=1 Tax=Panagrolaimus superbus TaxID=310955 RepID=A0A914YIB0_9BILA